MKKLIGILVIISLVTILAVSMVACGESNSAEPKVKVINVDLSSEEYAFAVKKNDTALLASVNAFFAAKKTEIDAIFAKYNAEGANLDDFGATYQTTPTQGATDELVVATNLDFAPFEYTVGNKIAGIDMEIAKLLADYLGKKLVIVHMDFEAVVTAVETLETYDIGIAGLTITSERAEQVAFSDAYFGATQVLVTKAGDTTFDGCTTEAQVKEKLASLTGAAAKCGGQAGTTSQYYVEGSEDFGFDGYENLKFAGYSSAALAIQDMINGNLGFVVVDKTTANAIVNEINK